VGAVGTGKVREVATKQMGDLFFTLGDDFLGTAGSIGLQILLCTSLFAATLALHSAANRYTQVLAEDGLLPASLGAEHVRYGSPHRASVAQSILTAVVVAGFAVEGLDPYADLTTSMLGLGTLGIVVLQAVAALSVLGLRLRRGRGHGSAAGGWWREVVAPALGFAGLCASVWLVVGNFDMLTGSPDPLIAELPWLLVAVTVSGLCYAAWLRFARPDRYRQLGSRHLAEHVPPPASGPPLSTTAPAPVPAAAGIHDREAGGHHARSA
jgi:amino acid transporter